MDVQIAQLIERRTQLLNFALHTTHRVLSLLLLALTLTSCMQRNLGADVDPQLVAEARWNNDSIIYDVNHDGLVDDEDMEIAETWLQSHAAFFTEKQNPPKLNSVDVNNDGVFDRRDIKWIKYVRDENTFGGGWDPKARLTPQVNRSIQVDLALELDEELELDCLETPSEDLGYSEKWFSGQGGKKYYILPNGLLFKRDKFASEDPLVHRFGSGYHSYPKLLCDANS